MRVDAGTYAALDRALDGEDLTRKEALWLVGYGCIRPTVTR
jgi:hypothetical protein